VQKSHQKKVREFLEKFEAHPESPGSHYEPIQQARDKNFYSVRIDQAYRAIIARPDPNVYVLMWVDHHDDAYQWAARKRLEVHPATGALQVIEPVISDEAAPTGRLFAQVKDKHLLGMGVPEELIAIVPSIDTNTDLEAAEAQFPQEAYEALFLLASGYTVDDVFRELERSRTKSQSSIRRTSALH
jgi:hypothetical protein